MSLLEEIKLAFLPSRKKIEEKVINPIQTLKESEVIINGFAREENQDNWIKNGWIEYYLETKEVRFKGEIYSIPEGKKVRCLAIYKGDQFFINILTRGENNLRKIHMI